MHVKLNIAKQIISEPQNVTFSIIATVDITVSFNLQVAVIGQEIAGCTLDAMHQLILLLMWKAGETTNRKTIF